jgi:hypothetical protein
MNITSRGWALRCWPPSTSKVVPVMAGDSTRKRTARATSSGVDERSSGVIAWACVNSPWFMSPDSSVTPGATPATRTRGASACASSVVAASSAAFDSV